MPQKMRYFSGVETPQKKRKTSSLKRRKSVTLKDAELEVSLFVPGNITNVVSVDEMRKERKKKRSSVNGFEVTDIISTTDDKLNNSKVLASEHVSKKDRMHKSIRPKRTKRSLSETDSGSNKDTSVKRKRSISKADISEGKCNEETSLSIREERDISASTAGSDNLVTAEEVEKATTTLFQLITSTAKKQRPELFETEAQPIYLQIACLRVPKVPTRIIRLSLPHSMVTETSDVCLFVPDLKKGPRIDHEPTVDFYRELLDKHGVKGITQIIPVRQLKDEYFQYEMRRRLCGSFDMFLADGRICGPIAPLLGKEFLLKKKSPTPLNLQSKNLKEEVRKALSKTPLSVSSKGDTMTVKIGHNQHSTKQLLENILEVVKQLHLHFPGGWHNIRSLSIKTARSLCVPLYVTMRSVNEVEVPVKEPKRPKAAVPVEDELSTIPGATVVVMPDGEVIVKKGAIPEDLVNLEGSEGEEEIEDTEDEVEDEENEGDIDEMRKEVQKVIEGGNEQISNAAAEDSNDDDSDVEAAEDAYLQGWAQELEEEPEEPAQKKQKQDRRSVKKLRKAVTEKVGKSKIQKDKKKKKKKKNVIKENNNTSSHLTSKSKHKKTKKSSC